MSVPKDALLHANALFQEILKTYPPDYSARVRFALGLVEVARLCGHLACHAYSQVDLDYETIFAHAKERLQYHELGSLVTHMPLEPHIVVNYPTPSMHERY